MKEYYVKVPGPTNESYYYKSKSGIDVFSVRNGRALQSRAKFTMYEILNYHLDSFNCIEAK